MKNKLLILAMGFALTTQMVMAQVPSYVPTNGLVGYWPFNGNANDESGNGNNGTVNGATLTTDRFGFVNSAYNFDGINNNLLISGSSSLNSIETLNKITIAGWFNNKNINVNSVFSFVNKYNPEFDSGWEIILAENYANWSTDAYVETTNTCIPTLPVQSWEHIAITYDQSTSTVVLYVNGINICTKNCSSTINNTNDGPLYFGYSPGGPDEYSTGYLDDIAIYNRALTDQEITNLYNSANTNECLTMTINTGPLSTNPVTYTSSVNIYPNPANDQITIDCGNLANVSGWSIKITNMLGQEVFNQPMDTQQYVVPLNSWTGQGMYFVKIINAQNEVVNIKKIILQ